MSITQHPDERATTIIRLVRLLTALGLGTALLILGIVWWTITSVREERQGLNDLRAELGRTVIEMREQIEEGRQQLTALLDVEDYDVQKNRNDWVPATKAQASEFEHLASRAQTPVQVEAVHHSLERLESLRSHCSDWRSRERSLLARTQTVSTQLDRSLSLLREAVESAEGEQRLEQAILYRKHRAGSENVLPRELLEQIVPRADLSSTKTELIDLTLLVERMLKEDQIDNLVDHKDNKLKPVLDRLRSLLERYDRSHPDTEGALLPLLDDVMTGLFGTDARYGPPDQSIVPGTDGAYVTIRRRLTLKSDAQVLRERAAEEFAQLDAAVAHLAAAKDDLVLVLSKASEGAFRGAWLVIALLSGAASVAFLFVAWRIRRAVRAQVDRIQEAKERVDAQTAKLSKSNMSLRREILERQQTEEALRDREEWLRTIIENSKDAMIAINAEGHVTLFNPAAEVMFGRGKDEVLAGSLDVLIPEPIRDDHHRYVEGYFSVGVPNNAIGQTVELSALRADGEIFPVELSLSAGEASSEPFVLAVIRDVTARKQTESALRESETLLRATLEATADGILVVDSEGRATHSNKRFAEMWRIPDELVSSGDDARLLASVLDQLAEPDAFTAKVQALYSSEKEDFDTLLFKDGRAFERFSCPLMQHGTVDGRVWSFRDVTQRRRTEEAVRLYADTQAVLLREVNHRVKNNLAAIVSMIHKEEQYAVAGGATDAIPLLDDLEGRVQGLLTVHSMLSQSGWRPLLLSDLCTQVVQGVLRGVPPDKTISLRVAPTTVEVSTEQAHNLTLVLNELATNSLKHSFHGRETGEIHIDFACNDTSCEPAEICINYRDNGPGFSQEMLEGRLEGAGIGFDLIQGIVKRSLRGRLEISNDEGALTRIVFRQQAST